MKKRKNERKEKKKRKNTYIKNLPKKERNPKQNIKKIYIYKTRPKQDH